MEGGLGSRYEEHRYIDLHNVIVLLARQKGIIKLINCLGTKRYSAVLIHRQSSPTEDRPSIHSL